MSPIIHGTSAGYIAHKKWGEIPCQPCYRAKADYAAHHRFLTGAHRDPRRCRECGSVFPGHACHSKAVPR